MTIWQTFSKSPAQAMHEHRRFLLPVSIVADLVRALDAAMVLLAGVVTTLAFDLSLFTDDGLMSCIVYVNFAVLLLSNHAALYQISAIMRPVSQSDNFLIIVATAMLLFMSVVFALGAGGLFDNGWLIAFGLSAALALGGGRFAAWRILSWASRRRLIGRNLVVLGAGEQARRALRRLRETAPYFTVVGGAYHADDAPGPDTIEGFPVLGGAETLLARARAGMIDDVLVAMPWHADAELKEAVERLKELPVNVYLAADLAGYSLAFRPVLGSFRELPMFEVVQRPISGWSFALKTIEDYLIAGVLVLLLAPLMALIAVAIRLDTPGPVLFRQKRLGFNNQVFEVLKFRSMHHCEAGEHAVVQATRRDPRVTRVGRFIRATSLDELPQIFNVLNGTMSLVGPRPHALSHNKQYSQAIRGYFARHRVKPGITGWAQVNGLRGETDTLEKMEARIRHDIYYADNWSLAFDIRILIQTGLVVFFQRSAY